MRTAVYGGINIVAVFMSHRTNENWANRRTQKKHARFSSREPECCWWSSYDSTSGIHIDINRYVCMCVCGCYRDCEQFYCSWRVPIRSREQICLSRQAGWQPVVVIVLSVYVRYRGIPHFRLVNRVSLRRKERKRDRCRSSPIALAVLMSRVVCQQQQQQAEGASEGPLSLRRGPFLRIAELTYTQCNMLRNAERITHHSRRPSPVVLE